MEHTFHSDTAKNATGAAAKPPAKTRGRGARGSSGSANKSRSRSRKSTKKTGGFRSKGFSKDSADSKGSRLSSGSDDRFKSGSKSKNTKKKPFSRYKTAHKGKPKNY